MASLTNFLTISSSLRARDSDNFVLAPNPVEQHVDSSVTIKPDEFKLYGKQYVRCSILAKVTKHNKKRTSIIWDYGEDIQLKKEPDKKYWYCYLCEKQRRQQELPVAGKGNTTALDHLEQRHRIDRS